MKNYLIYHNKSSYGNYKNVFNKNELLELLLKRKYFLSTNSIMLDNLNNENEFFKILKNRRSKRDFSNKAAITFKDFSTLIQYTFKVDHNNRCTPSAGNLFGVENYIYIKNVENIKEGIYLYNKFNHSITPFNVDFNVDFNEIFFEQDYTYNFSVCFILSVDLNNLYIKYNERSYRYGLIECGHIAQNIQLICNHLNRESVPIGAFKDCELIKFLKLKESILPAYCIFIN